MILEQDVLDRKSLVANNVGNALEAVLSGWSTPLERKFRFCKPNLNSLNFTSTFGTP